MCCYMAIKYTGVHFCNSLSKYNCKVLFDIIYISTIIYIAITELDEKLFYVSTLTVGEVNIFLFPKTNYNNEV